MVELEKKAAEAPWLVQDDSKTVISCMTTNDGKPYLGFVAGVGHYDTRDFIIALRNAAPDLFRLALRGLAAELRTVRACCTCGGLSLGRLVDELDNRSGRVDRDRHDYL